MGVYKVKNKYYINITVCGKRIRRSAGDSYEEACILFGQYMDAKRAKELERKKEILGEVFEKV